MDNNFMSFQDVETNTGVMINALHIAAANQKNNTIEITLSSGKVIKVLGDLSSFLNKIKGLGNKS